MTGGNLPKYGVFSPYTLTVHHTVTREKPDAFLKRAAILFDQCVFVPEGLGDLMDPGNPLGQTWWLDAFLGKDDRAAIEEYRGLFLHCSDFWADGDDIWRRIRDDHEHDLWHGESADEFGKWVSQQVERDVHTGAIADDPGERYEQHKMYLGNLSYDYKLLTALSETSPDFAGLFTPAHEEAALATFGQKTANADAVLQTISEVGTLDLAALSWAQIFTLRKSGFLQDFRSRIAEWMDLYVETPVSADFQAALSRMTTDALFTLVGETSPNLPLSVLSAVVGILPGLGAVSAAKTLLDLSSERDRQLRNGWLYFIQKARAVDAK